MSKFLGFLVSLVLLSLPAAAQAPAFQDPFLDHMVGKWVLHGTIAEGETTHDVVAEWVLGHQYVRLHEVSREKDSQGQPAYEAIVFIGQDPAPKGRYACLWLDGTGGGGLSATAIGHGRMGADRIAFLFKGGDGSLFHTTFVYGKDDDTWRWIMDGESGGKLHPFARLKLTRDRA